jgi:release factor glutamine methyltransferase
MRESDFPIAEIGRTVWSDNVYEPSDDSFLLVDALQKNACLWLSKRPSIVLEIGSGSGYVICSAARMLKHRGIHSHLIAVDINPAACSATLQTLQGHEIHDVEIITSDLLAPLLPRLCGMIDVLIFNPPYVPTPDHEVCSKGISQAWAGGERGRLVIDRLLSQLPDLLSRKGDLIMVAVAENDVPDLIKTMEGKGFPGSVLLTRHADEELLSILHFARALS